jgi:hypothetical protein
MFSAEKTGGACAWLPRGHPVEEVVGVWREPPSQVPGKGDPAVGISVGSNHQDEWIFFSWMEKYGKIWMNLNLVKF